jgi:hypothetical protein
LYEHIGVYQVNTAVAHINVEQFAFSIRLVRNAIICANIGFGGCRVKLDHMFQLESTRIGPDEITRKYATLLV